jgi:hypothetical protein
MRFDRRWAARIIVVLTLVAVVRLAPISGAPRRPQALAAHSPSVTAANAPAAVSTIVTTPTPAAVVPIVPVTTAAPAVAPPPTRVAGGDAEVARAALGLIAYPWHDRLHATINFLPPRPGMRAHSTAFPDHAVVDVYLRPTDTAEQTAVNIAHELGHLIDWYLLNDADRARWSALRGRPGAVWWACDSCTDYATGSGDFAETFAASEVAASDYRSVFAPLPAAAEMATLRTFFK